MGRQQHLPKDALLNLMRTGYAAFDALLESMSEEQLTTPNVNGSWSIKDNISHLAWWEQSVLTYLQTGEKDPLAGLNVEEKNERVYQQAKDRPLKEVRDDLRTISEALIAHVEAMS
jgi:hypothetical protein